MSRVFKRPMFRKGGNVGDGIMTGIVDRENHAISDVDGVGGQTFRDEVQNRIDLINSVSGGTGLDDPLTQFLLQYGPALATERGGGSTFGNIVAAAKKPVEGLLKRQSEKRKLKTGVALEVLDSLEDEDIAPFIEKARQIAKETGRDYKTVLNSLVETELYRKPKSPQEIKAENLEVDIASLMSVKDPYQNPLINKYGAEEVAMKIRDVKQGKVPGVAYEDIDIDQPYLLKKSKIIEKNDETGTLTLDESSIRKYTQGAVIYDYRTNKFYKVQGQKLLPVGE